MSYLRTFRSHWRCARMINDLGRPTTTRWPGSYVVFFRKHTGFFFATHTAVPISFRAEPASVVQRSHDAYQVCFRWSSGMGTWSRTPSIGTGPEIWRPMNGEIVGFVAGAGQVSRVAVSILYRSLTQPCNLPQFYNPLQFPFHDSPRIRRVPSCFRPRPHTTKCPVAHRKVLALHQVLGNRAKHSQTRRLQGVCWTKARSRC
jgi:hypothetical protein